MEHPLQEFPQAAEKTSESEQMETTEMRGSSDSEIVADDPDKKANLEDDAWGSKPPRFRSTEIITVDDKAPEICAVCKVNPVYYIPKPDSAGNKLPRSKSDDMLGITSRVVKTRLSHPADITFEKGDPRLTTPIQKKVSPPSLVETLENQICFSCELKMGNIISEPNLTDKMPEPTKNPRPIITTVVRADVHRSGVEPSLDEAAAGPTKNLLLPPGPHVYTGTIPKSPTRCAICTRKKIRYKKPKKPKLNILGKKLTIEYQHIDMGDTSSTANDEADEHDGPWFVGVSGLYSEETDSYIKRPKQPSSKAEKITFREKEGKAFCDSCKINMTESIEVFLQAPKQSSDLEKIEFADVTSFENMSYRARQAKEKELEDIFCPTRRSLNPSPRQSSNIGDVGNRDEVVIRQPGEITLQNESTALLTSTFSCAVEMKKFKFIVLALVIFFTVISVTIFFNRKKR